MAAKEGLGDCVTCGAKCCRYVTIQIDKPARKVDVDETRWFLAHENIQVLIEDKQWYVQVHNRCKHLAEDNRCAIYGDRFDVCRQHDLEECEGSDGKAESIEFHSTEQFDAYWANEQAKRKAKRRRSKKARKSEQAPLA